MRFIFLIPPSQIISPPLPEHYPQIISSIINAIKMRFPRTDFGMTLIALTIPKTTIPTLACCLDYEVAGQVFMVKEDDQVCVNQVSIRHGDERDWLVSVNSCFTGCT